MSPVITNAEIKNIVCEPSDLNYIVNIGNIYLEEKIQEYSPRRWFCVTRTWFKRNSDSLAMGLDTDYFFYYPQNWF